jgi:hypothetical protein
MFGDGFKGKGGALSKQTKLSKQLIDIWASTMTPETRWQHRLLIVAAVLCLHSLLLIIPLDWLQNTRPSKPAANSVKVTLTRTQTQQPLPSDDIPVEPVAPKIKKQQMQRQSSKRKVLTSNEPDPNLPPDTPKIVAAPDSPVAKATPAPLTPSGEKALMEDVVSPLLPAGKKDFLTQQQRLGEAIGAGPIAGDIEVPDVVTEKDPKDPVTRTEYTFAGYFDNLSRRFSETWGGVRTLPPQSRFDGKLGEFIEYDIVINRDGSLRKIVNVSARREPYRNFAAVDQLVLDVFKTMFPFQPVPARIRNDPLVVRKRIQFVGFKYTLY